MLLKELGQFAMIALWLDRLPGVWGQQSTCLKACWEEMEVSMLLLPTNREWYVMRPIPQLEGQLLVG